MSEPIKQPEALWRRAIEKAIRPGASLPLMDWARAAAELRRLHAEVERLRAELSATTERLENRAGTVQALCAETVRLEAERDEANGAGMPSVPRHAASRQLTNPPPADG